MRKQWKVNPLTSFAVELGVKYGLPPELIQIFINRNILEADFNSFLNPAVTDLHSPFLLPDMRKAVERIKKAVSGKEKILIAGDYDVDGITSLAVFYEFIKEFTDKFSFYIPHRVKEGYGLNKQAVNQAKSQERTLIVAFDCGTNSLSEIELANSLGIDVIVVDHHIPQDNLPAAFALVNPKRKDSVYPFCDLSAAALSFKLLQALKNEPCWEVLDLVALSLVCDVVPLQGENRILLKQGLKYLRTTTRPAIRSLCKLTGLKQENIDTFHIGFILGPRINASGRVAHARESLDMFLTQDEEESYDIASRLDGYNKLRKDTEAQILREAEESLSKDCFDKHAIVVAGDSWHPGVLGIVASRLVNKYYRPCFVFSFDENIGRGSARSIPCVHLIEVLDKCAQYLQGYGGHRKAAGIQIFKEELEIFKDKVNTLIKDNLTPQDLIPVLEIEVEIQFSGITMSFIDQLEKLKPFGEDNSKPLFISYGVLKKSILKKIPSGYSIWLNSDNRMLEGVIYDKDLLQIIEYGSSFDIVYCLEKNTYHNIPRLAIKDCKLSGREG